MLGGAPYGYRSITRTAGGGEAHDEINQEQAQVVRQIFDGVGRQRLRIGEGQRRLTAAATLTPTGQTGWDRPTIWGIVKNPADQGQAAFGKTRAGELRLRLRKPRGRSLQPRRARSTYGVPAEQWLWIPVPPIIAAALFAAVPAQLEENRRRARCGQRGAKDLRQGLLVCGGGGYAFYGKPISPSARKQHPRAYAYYRGVGADAYRFGGQRLGDNPPMRTDRLEQAVWSEVCRLLEPPQRLADEYQHRLEAVQVPPGEADTAWVDPPIAKRRQGISRLIDGDAAGYLDQAKAEPRIRRFKERLQGLEAQAEPLRAQARQQADLRLVIGQLEAFSTKVKTGLEQLDGAGRRALIRTLVKRVEIDQERVNVVFRVDGSTLPPVPNPFMQHCGRSGYAPFILRRLNLLLCLHP